MKLPNENSHRVFKTRRVRYAKADELELYISSSTSPVKRRHQLMLEVLLLFTHCRWMNTSTVRRECATLSLYTTSRTTDTAPMLSFAGSRVEVNFVDVCGSDARRGSPELQQVRLPVRFSRRRLRLSLRTHTSVLLYSDTVLCPGDISQTRANGCIETKIPPQRVHAACRIVTRRSCCAKRFAEFNGNCESYCSLEQLVASLSTQMRKNLLQVRIIRRQKATTSEDTCTNHPVCCIVGGALGLE